MYDEQDLEEKMETNKSTAIELGATVIVKWKDKQFYTANIIDPPADAPPQPNNNNNNNNNNKKTRNKNNTTYYFVKFDDGDTDWISKQNIYANDQDTAFFSDEDSDTSTTTKSKPSTSQKRRKGVKTRLSKKEESDHEQELRNEEEEEEISDNDINESSEEEEEDEKEIEICGACGKEGKNKYVKCEICNKGWHINCLVPPLPNVPTEQWLCQSCLSAPRPSRSKSRANSIKITRSNSKTETDDDVDTQKETKKKQPISTTTTTKKLIKPKAIFQSNDPFENIKKPTRTITSDDEDDNAVSTSQSLDNISVNNENNNNNNNNNGMERSTSVDMIGSSPAASPASIRKKPSFGNPLDTIKIERPKITTSTFWKGGLLVDGTFICNIIALSKAENPQQLFVRNEWSKMIEGTKTTALPTIPTDATLLLNLLSEKNDPSYNVLIFNLEKNNQVLLVQLTTRLLYIVPSSLVPAQKSLNKKSSLFAFTAPKLLESPKPEQIQVSMSQSNNPFLPIPLNNQINNNTITNTTNNNTNGVATVTAITGVPMYYQPQQQQIPNQQILLPPPVTTQITSSNSFGKLNTDVKLWLKNVRFSILGNVTYN